MGPYIKTMTMDVAFKVDGEVVHARNITGMVSPDVFDVAASGGKPTVSASERTYWSDHVPQMIATRSVPDGGGWGRYPTPAGSVSRIAGGVYNVMTLSFTPASLKGIIVITSPTMAERAGDAFGEPIESLTNSWTAKFGGDPFFIVVDAKETGTRLLEQIDANIQ